MVYRMSCRIELLAVRDKKERIDWSIGSKIVGGLVYLMWTVFGVPSGPCRPE